MAAVAHSWERRNFRQGLEPPSADGAQELDFVVNVAALKEKDLQYFCREIKKVRAVSKEITLKVILETSLLDEKEKIVAARAAAYCGADMLKTSTGFFGGVTIDDVKLLKEAVPGIPVKASGGIRTADFALAAGSRGREAGNEFGLQDYW